MSEPTIPAELLAVSTLSLATVGQDGEPHTAPVYFSADSQLQCYFFSNQDSQHGRNLQREPRASAAFYPECFHWKEIRGVQLRGIARPMYPGADWDRAWHVYRTKFPFVEELADLLGQNRLYVLKPNWVRLVDNRQGFGFKQEWTLA